MKKIIVVISVIIIILVSLYLLKDTIIKLAIEKTVRDAIGLRIEIGELKASILRAAIDIRGLRVLNPEGFSDRLMADFPEIYADFSLKDAFKNKMRFIRAKIELKEFIVIKNRDGILNLSSVKTVSADQKQQKTKYSISDIQIDSLRLKIGRAVYKDYSKGEPPSIKEYNINLDEEYTNITDIKVLVNLIIAKALAKTAIAELAGFNLELLQGSISKVTEVTGSIASKAVDATEKALNAATDKIKDIFQF